MWRFTPMMRTHAKAKRAEIGWEKWRGPAVIGVEPGTTRKGDGITADGGGGGGGGGFSFDGGRQLSTSRPISGGDRGRKVGPQPRGGVGVGSGRRGQRV
jgi:hypothetical protein